MGGEHFDRFSGKLTNAEITICEQIFEHFSFSFSLDKQNIDAKTVYQAKNCP